MFRVECSCCSDRLAICTKYGQAVEMARLWSRHTGQGTRAYYSSDQLGSIDVLVYLTY